MLVNDNDRKIYVEELAPRLPAKILDAHVHIWSKTDFPADFQFKPGDCSGRFGGEFTIPQWRNFMKELLPEQECHLNCFGTPRKEADRSCTPRDTQPGDYVNVLLSPADPAEVVEERLVKSGAVGVKPYLNYAAEYYGKPKDAVEIADMLTEEQLKMLNRRKLAITLHIPRSGRFADPVNQRQMIDLCEKYPDIRFIFAHIGRAYFMKNLLESNLTEFVNFPNAFFDTAMVNHEGVLKRTFDLFPAERILFGTDAPIALLRGKSVEINDQYAYVMGEDYQIGTTIRGVGSPVKFTTFFYEQLRAMLNTIPAGKVEDVFFNNADQLFRSVGK